jgi:hypothetical protein
MKRKNPYSVDVSTHDCDLLILAEGLHGHIDVDDCPIVDDSTC